MADTRNSLKDKLETLENQVKETVQGATDAVETVKETVKETVESVKETVEETVESVKETFNLRKHVQEHPWPAFACATVVGFVGGRLLGHGLAVNGEARTEEAAVPQVPLSAYRNGGTTTPPLQPPAQRSWWSWVADHYSEELTKVKGLAIAVAGGLVRDMVTAEVTPEIGERLKEVIDGFTQKLGAEPIKEPIFKPAPPESSEEKGGAQRGFVPRWERSQIAPR